MSDKSALVAIADGSEDIESVAIIDVLRRANVAVTVASIKPHGELQITASRGTNIVADTHIDNCTQNTYDIIVLPGGLPGAEHLRDCVTLVDMLRHQEQAGRLYAAICASPALVFASHGLEKDRQTTCHPGFTEQLSHFRNQRVVVDQNCITSQGPGTALEFALELVLQLLGQQARDQVAAPMVL